jgi:hypothetical protein
MSTFASLQPLYAEHGIATFPVLKGVRKPAVTGNLRMGLSVSRELVARKPGLQSPEGRCPASFRLTEKFEGA